MRDEILNLIQSTLKRLIRVIRKQVLNRDEGGHNKHELAMAREIIKMILPECSILLFRCHPKISFSCKTLESKNSAVAQYCSYSILQLHNFHDLNSILRLNDGDGKGVHVYFL